MPEKRKIIILISALLIIFDIGFTLTALNAGERRFTATLEAVAVLVRNYLDPIPTLRD